MQRILITASKRFGRQTGLKKDGALLLFYEYRSIAAITIGVVLLLIAANLENPTWWLAVGWIPIAVYVASRVFALPRDDPRQQAVLLSAVGFFVFGGYGTSSLDAFGSAVVQPSFENIITFCVSRGFLLSTTICFAVACLGYRGLLDAKEDELDQCRSALDDSRARQREPNSDSDNGPASKTISPETQRRLESYKKRIVRGRRLRKLRESSNSPNGLHKTDHETS